MKKANLSKKDEIQLLYPDEPDWKKVEEITLIELAQDFVSEQSCATIALSEFFCRKNSKVEELALNIIDSKIADKWLKSSALGILLKLNFKKGLDLSLCLVDDCEKEILMEIIEALNYEFQDLKNNFLIKHEIIDKIKRRLSLRKIEDDSVKIFYKNFK